MQSPTSFVLNSLKLSPILLGRTTIFTNVIVQKSSLQSQISKNSYCSDSYSESTEGESKPEPMRISDERISDRTRMKLSKRKIETLMPIQHQTFEHIFNGDDVVGRAFTGSGKTLAFALPITEKLSNEHGHGRLPRAVIVVPTRELCTQVAGEFKSISNHHVLAIYGGVSYIPQRESLQSGIDIIVGTPGRIIDLMNSGDVNLSEIEFVVLDEADLMLDQGFTEAIETILSSAATERQTLLFSATMPPWIQNISKKYLKKKHKVIDLIGNSASSMPTTIKHLAMSVKSSTKVETLLNLLKTHSLGQTLIFVETKKLAAELSSHPDIGKVARALHGDVSQVVRNHTISDFRNKKFNFLIGTDVAARGIDIPAIETVIQYELPQTVESYIHRAGRCSRGGKHGTCIVMFSDHEINDVKFVERKLDFKFEMTAPPADDEIIDAQLEKISGSMTKILRNPELLDDFKERSEKLLAEHGWKSLAAALAIHCGISEKKSVSKWTGVEGNVALKIGSTNSSGVFFGSALNALRDLNGNLAVFQVGRTSDGGLALDITQDYYNSITRHLKYFNSRFTATVLDEEPEIVEDEDLQESFDSYFTSLRSKYSKGSGNSWMRGGGGGNRGGNRGGFESRNRGGFSQGNNRRYDSGYSGNNRRNDSGGRGYQGGRDSGYRGGRDNSGYKSRQSSFY